MRRRKHPADGRITLGELEIDAAARDARVNGIALKLTPMEFGQRFGLSDHDLQAIRSWIESQGLTVKWVAPGRNFIGFGGPAATVGHAFGTTVHNYQVDRAQVDRAQVARAQVVPAGGVAGTDPASVSDRISVSSDPMIPAALAPVVKAVRGLYTIPDQPQHGSTVPQVGTVGQIAAPGLNS